MKIISGGQTGVDRAALDVALLYGVECGGWCPAGRLDEFGKIPDRYPVQELKRNIEEGRSQDRDVFAERTLQNVEESDGTVIIHSGNLSGGTGQTLQFCIEQQRPHKLIDAKTISAQEAADMIHEFVRANKISILNVAGPRQSGWPGGYEYAFCAVEAFVLARQTRATV